MLEGDLPEGVEGDQVRRMMRRVLESEKEKLHMKSPMGINDDIQSIIEDEVR